MRLLVLNPGSSTLKFALYEMPGEVRQRQGVVAPLERAETVLATKFPPDVPDVPLPNATLSDAAARIVARAGDAPLDAVVCRVVHGGERFREAVLVTPDVLREMNALSNIAPLHNPLSVAVIESVQKSLPNVPVVAVFDTAFHKTLPPLAKTYALPHDDRAFDGLHKYGFHGISYRFVCDRLSEITAPRPPERAIICHLGNGASLCALKNGESVETTMGMTPLAGLIMGTRSGDVDPGLLLHLLQNGMTPADLTTILNKQSGLLGLSGTSGDMRDLKKAMDAGDERARFARDAFAYRIAQYIGAYTVTLGGLDALVFTAGIGENDPDIRANIINRLQSLRISLDKTANETPSGEGGAIHGDDSAVPVWVIPTNKERQMARDGASILSGTGK